MTDNIAGLPFWEIGFGSDGAVTGGAMDGLQTDLRARGITDLFVFSHGWNNDRATARSMYEGVFGELGRLWRNISAKTGSPAPIIGTAGVFWPSMAWADELPTQTGGAAALHPTIVGIEVGQLKDLFPDAPDGDVAMIHELLRTQPRNDESLSEFMTVLARIMSSAAPETPAEDSLELRALIDEAFRPNAISALSQGRLPDGSEGGAASVGDTLSRLWDGAKDALRVATYWQMKNRAGIVGRVGLGPFMARLAADRPALLIHLVGHSFGARVVSYSLAGLEPRAASPVKSLVLLQGAFSHFAFADELPFDRQRSGDLKGKAGHVDGPLLATFTDYDLAVGRSYPLASVVAGQDASDASMVVSRWGAMGSDGAQAVNAIQLPIAEVGHPYGFSKGRWYNLDANAVIRVGDPPSGAHSDIIHPQIAWAMLSAAGLV